MLTEGNQSKQTERMTMSLEEPVVQDLPEEIRRSAVENARAVAELIELKTER